MTPPVVVNVRDFGRDLVRTQGLPDDVTYIGRAVPSWGLRRSRWANPFKLGTLDRATTILLYERDLRARLAAGRVASADILALGGRRLACWCRPEPCHGDVLVRLWHEASAGGRRPDPTSYN